MDETVKALKKSLKANKRIDEGTVVRFKKFGGFTYVGLYVNAAWWLTGNKNIRIMAYDDFMAFLGDAEDVEVATKWENLS